MGGHKALHIIILCARAKGESNLIPLIWGGGVPGGRGGRYGYTDEITLSKECEALKKGLRIHEMKKGLKKKRYIYWLDGAFILFPSEQTTKERPYAFLFRNQTLIIAHYFGMHQKNLIGKISHFLQIGY